jgi:hypothetical protein
MELNSDKSKLKSKLDLYTDLSSILGNDSQYFSRDWIADLLGFNKHIIRKEKINKVYDK